MEQKSKDSPKTKEILRQLQAEMRQLQETVYARDAVRPEPENGVLDVSKGDWAVQLVVQSPEQSGNPKKVSPAVFTRAQLAHVKTEDVALLGGAVSSPQKVALLRALSEAHDGEGAAALGASVSLSTGSLYHHLHDLSHAGLICQSARNRYALTAHGRRVLLTLLALTTHGGE